MAFEWANKLTFANREPIRLYQFDFVPRWDEQSTVPNSQISMSGTPTTAQCTQIGQSYTAELLEQSINYLKENTFITAEGTTARDRYIIYRKDDGQYIDRGYIATLSEYGIAIAVDEDTKTMILFNIYKYTSSPNQYGISVVGLNNSAFKGDGNQNYVFNAWGFFKDNASANTDDPDEGGGGGEASDDGNDDVDFPDLPDVSATDTGLINIYNPSVGELNALASYMWTDDFYTNIIKLRANPIDNILGLSIVPVNVPSGGREEIKVGNVSTRVEMTVASSQYCIVDCGSITIHGKTASYLDYAPYTKVKIFLPYCGTHDLNTDEVMNKTIHVKYHVDVLTGNCIAFVKVGGSVLYEFSGNCMSSIPISSANYGSMYLSAIMGVSKIVGGALSKNASMMEQGVKSTANVVASGKPDVQHSGSLSGAQGQLGHQKPYLIFEKPRRCIPTNQNQYMGYPTFKTVKLSDLSGYTEIDSIKLSKVSCTETEQNELIELLKSGVFI